MSQDSQDILERKVQNIKLFISDVDGVFTDGSFYVNGEGQEYKKFSARDGLGIGLLKAAEIPIAIISGKHSEATTYRMEELGITEDVYQGRIQKIGIYQRIKEKYEFEDKEIAYIGDDLVDIPILKKVGCSFTVPDACEEVKSYCSYTTNKSGGDGALREVIELILKTQNEYIDAVDKILG